MDLITPAILILVPAGAANIMASLSRYIFPRWNTPIDFGRGWFGAHKTWRGLILGCFGGAFISGVLVYSFSGNLMVTIPIDILFTGLMLSPVSFGALLGDLIKSFFKRRVGIAPGRSWIPFDQVDWVLGALGTTWLLTREFDWQLWVSALVIGGLIHPAFNVAGRFFRLQKNWL